MSTIRDLTKGMSKEDIIKALEQGTLGKSVATVESEYGRNSLEATAVRKAVKKTTAMDILNAPKYEAQKLAIEQTPSYAWGAFAIGIFIMLVILGAGLSG